MPHKKSNPDASLYAQQTKATAQIRRSLQADILKGKAFNPQGVRALFQETLIGDLFYLSNSLEENPKNQQLLKDLNRILETPNILELVSLHLKFRLLETIKLLLTSDDPAFDLKINPANKIYLKFIMQENPDLKELCSLEAAYFSLSEDTLAAIKRDVLNKLGTSELQKLQSLYSQPIKNPSYNEKQLAKSSLTQSLSILIENIFQREYSGYNLARDRNNLIYLDFLCNPQTNHTKVLGTINQSFTLLAKEDLSQIREQLMSRLEAHQKQTLSAHLEFQQELRKSN